MIIVKVYSSPSCAYCFTLKRYLKDNNIEFEDIDVSKNQEALEEIIKKTNQLSVPIIDINGQIVIGFDKEKINKLLNIRT